MKTQLKNYQSPSTAISRVQLESAICDGSVTYTGPDEKGVQISGQEVATTENNDFTGQNWEVNRPSTSEYE